MRKDFSSSFIPFYSFPSFKNLFTVAKKSGHL
jgi:hypothetical protein